MGIETFSGIWSFNTTYPVSASDAVRYGANHLRGIKSAIQTTFPSITGAVTVTHTQINTIPDLAPKASPVLTGMPVAPTPSAGDNSTQIATTAFVTTAINAAGSGLTVRMLDKGRLNFYGG